jgi:3-methyl-2-oxobutanoate hydroxymethyltransferase
LVTERRKFTVLDLAVRKAQCKTITMVTAYDASSAQHVEAANIDIALVGDSAANVIQGKSSTNGMTMEQMLVHCESVARQCPNTFVVGDLPFGAYVNADVAVANAVLLIKAGCDAVKLEGGRRMAPVIRAIKNAGIVVIAHVGVTPQTSAEQGGFKTQGRDLTSALELVEDCLEVERAGASAVVLEMVVAEVSAIISKALKIPTIGIGAGAGVDGQVLVYHDLLGLLRGGHNPRFAKRYANLFDIATKGIRDFGRECQSHEFPKQMHSFLAPAGLEQSVLAELVKRGIQLQAPKQTRPDPIERVCVIGGGALGSLFSHLLGKSANVVMLSSFVEHVDAVNKQGGVLIDAKLSPVKAVTSVDAVRQHFGGSEPDLIIILVKSRDTNKAAEHAALLQGSRSIVLSLQNGIGHADVIYKRCGEGRSILGTTSMAAALSGVPGAVHLNGWGPVTLSSAGWRLMGTQVSSQEVRITVVASFFSLSFSRSTPSLFRNA